MVQFIWKWNPGLLVSPNMDRNTIGNPPDRCLKLKSSKVSIFALLVSALLNSSEMLHRARQCDRMSWGNEVLRELSRSWYPFQLSNRFEKFTEHGSSDRARQYQIPDGKVHGAHMGPTWVLSVPGRPHMDPINLAVRDGLRYCAMN